MGVNRIRLIKNFERIAAGEVIERPASVVKELVENSIDAKADQITVIIKQFGKELIQVIDNGVGIHPDDVETAFKAHTSSKIDSADDLNRLQTMGFRGEALYSISAISKIEMITRTAENDMAIKIMLEDGVTKSIEHVGAPVGTNIKVKDIFYNTPVRFKFLKTDKVEIGHITDIITRLLLAYPNIHFKLIHDEETIINSPATLKFANKLFEIYGKKVVSSCVNFFEDNLLFKIKGYIGDPALSRSTSLSSSVFVNKRYVLCPLINTAMEEAYKDYLMVNKKPFFILFMEVDPATVDFNIHPTKKIIRFDNEPQLLNALIGILKKIVDDNFAMQKRITAVQSVPTSSSAQSNSQSNKAKGGIRGNNGDPQSGPIQSESELKAETVDITIQESPSEIKLDRMYKITENQNTTQARESWGKTQNNLETETEGNTGRHGKWYRDQWISTQCFPKMRLINESGQLNKTYIVFEGEEGFYLLDQHAAAERIKYEEQMEFFKKGGLQRQALLSPLSFEVSVNERHFVEDMSEDLSKYGFEIDSLGGNTFAIRSIPAILATLRDFTIIKDICMEIIAIGRQSSLTNEVDKIIKYIACHKSLRGGEEVNDPVKVRDLLIRLSKCKNPHHCAHGRPTLLYLTFEEIEKLFHRIQ